MGRQSPLKSLGSLLLGLALAAVGMDTVSGNLRLTFDRPELLRGISFLVAVIGLFGIGEMLATMEEDLAFKGLALEAEPDGRVPDMVRSCRATG